MNKYLLSLFIICVSRFACAAQTEAYLNDSVFEADPYFLLMGEAEDAIKEQNWPEAAARLSDALGVKPNHPSNALVLYNLAKVYSCIGNDTLAVATYNRGLDIAPNMTVLYLGRGKTYLNMGKQKSAFADFEHVIKLDSLSTEARYLHGMISLYGGNMKGAEADFNVLESVAPKSFDTAIALAPLYSMTGRERKAIPYFERIIETEPTAEFYAALAGCHLALNELTEASEVLGEAMMTYPKDAELYYYRARLNRDRFRNDDARRDAERAIELGANPVKVNELFKSNKR